MLLECWTRSGSMPRADWSRDISSGWKIQLSSTLAAPDFWELIMMTWPSELFREDRTRRYSIGALHGAEDQAKRKSKSGMRFLPNVAGGMQVAQTSPQPRSDRVGRSGTIFKPGSTCMTSKKAERRGNDFVPVRN